MRCTDPRTVGFLADGKTITWSPKKYSKEYATFQLPCGKCIECRLEYARSWAVRCVHEAKMHENNCFVTLTYDDANLKSDKLDYNDFQTFIKALRDHLLSNLLDTIGTTQKAYRSLPKALKNDLTKAIQIGFFVTGEYGEKNKRPHWHVCIFNYSPTDARYKYSNDNGDKIYESKILSNLWGKGTVDFGEVTFESAGYCARYAAKKLVHGNDGDHDYHPVSKKSSKHAIGKKWIEKNWKNVFELGFILINGQKIAIPRYYEKWLQKHQPKEWMDYVTKTKHEKILKASNRASMELSLERETNHKRRDRNPSAKNVTTRNQARKKIMKQKFKQLQDYLKL